jgi:hypothetical protein
MKKRKNRKRNCGIKSFLTLTPKNNNNNKKRKEEKKSNIHFLFFLIFFIFSSKKEKKMSTAGDIRLRRRSLKKRVDALLLYNPNDSDLNLIIKELDVIIEPFELDTDDKLTDIEARIKVEENEYERKTDDNDSEVFKTPPSSPLSATLAQKKSPKTERDIRARIRDLKTRIDLLEDEDPDDLSVDLILADLDAVSATMGDEADDDLDGIETRIEETEDKRYESKRKEEELKKKIAKTARSLVSPSSTPKTVTDLKELEVISMPSEPVAQKKKKKDEKKDTNDVIDELDKLVKNLSLRGDTSERTLRQVESIRLDAYLKEQKAQDAREEDERQRKLEAADNIRKQNINFNRDIMLATSKVL